MLPSEEDRRQWKSAAAMPMRFTMPYYYVERLGRANHHLPFHCLHAGVLLVLLSPTMILGLFQVGVNLFAFAVA